jgi:hypothetical protein
MVPHDIDSFTRRLQSKTFLELVQALLYRFTAKFIYLDCLLMLELPKLPVFSDRLIRGRGQVREAVAADIDEMSLCEGKPSHLFKERFERGDFAVVGLIDGKVVGYEWFSTRDYYYDEHYHFGFKLEPGHVFAYDGYISVEYRVTGFYPKFKQFLAQKMVEMNLTTVVCLVDVNNRVAKNTCLRSGFKHIATYWVAKLGRHRFSLKSQVNQEQKTTPNKQGA